MIKIIFERRKIIFQFSKKKTQKSGVATYQLVRKLERPT